MPEAFPGRSQVSPSSAPDARRVPDLSDALDLGPELPTEGAGHEGPKFGPIGDSWLRDAVGMAAQLSRGFPPQIRLEYSQEDGVPFTIVASRANQQMTVKAMLQFVEFLAAIPTPPQARIELINVPSLDRTFQSNVQAALEPHFSDRFMIESHPGRIEIFFNDPDPGWEAWPRLPIAEG